MVKGVSWCGDGVPLIRVMCWGEGDALSDAGIDIDDNDGGGRAIDKTFTSTLPVEINFEHLKKICVWYNNMVVSSY